MRLLPVPLKATYLVVFLLGAPCFGQEGPGGAAQPAAPGELVNQESVVLPVLQGEAGVSYPENATGAARVSLELSIDAEGRVTDAVVKEGQEPFARAALEAARSFQFSPALVAGEPRAVKISFFVEFEPPPPASPALARHEANPATGLSPEPPHHPDRQTEREEVEVAVGGERETGNARVTSDALAALIPGAEGDPLRAVQALPGAVPIFAASPFMGLRGSPPAKVGYEFDGIRVPYLYHLGLSAAVLHPWMVDSASTYGAGPARLGQAVGGLMEARASLPERRLRGEVRVRGTESSAGAEAPFMRGKGSVLVAGRYSYMEPLVSLVAPEFRLDYWDYQARVSVDVGERDQVELMAFGAGDLTAQIMDDGSVEQPFNGSFHRVRLAWTHRGERGKRSRVSVLAGHDRWDAVPDQERPHASSFTARGESSIPLSGASLLEVGAEATYRRQLDEVFSAPALPSSSFQRDDVDLGAWVEWVFAPEPDLSLSLGLRADALWSEASPLGAEGWGVSLSPRESLSYRVHPQVRIHQSAGMQSQRPSGSQRTPGRLFSTEGGLERSLLADAGVEIGLPLGVVLDVSGFAGALWDMDDVGSLRSLQGQPLGLGRGMGRVIGLEASAQRVFGNHLRGVVSYTLSRAERSVGVVKGPARYDRTHVLSVAGNYDFGNGWSVASRVLLYTGFPGRMQTVAEAASPLRSTPYVQLDVQGEKRWMLGDSGAFLAATLGMLNANLRKDSTDLNCTTGSCDENLVGPAAIPTLGIMGRM